MNCRAERRKEEGERRQKASFAKSGIKVEMEELYASPQLKCCYLKMEERGGVVRRWWGGGKERRVIEINPQLCLGL
ncbi:unnamed protein product [Enterobius vermicularis]|uniref:Uncharacterized protein n=1 Tax=Enterobius vermicularis TaxID=51028 RepID=A0A0N4VQN2_ENTVE|nr:unnamed protein product [Enterobius vermicularis]